MLFPEIVLLTEMLVGLVLVLMIVLVPQVAVMVLVIGYQELGVVVVTDTMLLVATTNMLLMVTVRRLFAMAVWQHLPLWMSGRGELKKVFVRG